MKGHAHSSNVGNNASCLKLESSPPDPASLAVRGRSSALHVSPKLVAKPKGMANLHMKWLLLRHSLLLAAAISPGKCT